MSDGTKKLAAYLNRVAGEAGAIQSRLCRLEHCIREIAEKLEPEKKRKVNHDG